MTLRLMLACTLLCTSQHTSTIYSSAPTLQQRLTPYSYIVFTSRARLGSVRPDFSVCFVSVPYPCARPVIQHHYFSAFHFTVDDRPWPAVGPVASSQRHVSSPRLSRWAFEPHVCGLRVACEAARVLPII